MTRLFPQLHSWWLLCLSTIITITIVAASQLFTERISRLLDLQASELMAADLMIQSSETIADEFAQQARELGLMTARTVSLRTAIFIDDEPQLVELKAVSENYPLRGTLETRQQLFEPAQKTSEGPQRGEVWVDSRIAEQVGQPIELGMSKITASTILHYEPDRGGSLFNLAPRIMMHIDDLADTQLIVPGSRARYRLLVAGDLTSLKQFETTVQPLLGKGQRLQTLENARPEMRNALERTRKFFAFSIVLTLVIAMIATAITARYAASREAMKVAVLRTFGIPFTRLITHYAIQIGKIWLWALPLGMLFGYLAQFPLQWALGYWFGTRLPDSGLMPFLMAALVGLVSLIGFSLPSVVNVLDAPPMQVLRRSDRKLSHWRATMVAISSLLTLYAVLLLIVNHFLLATILLLLILVIGAVIPLLLRLILAVFGRVAGNTFWIRGYVRSRLLSPHRHALYVMSGFSLTLLAVLLISHVKDQLILDWETQLPQDKPNYFMVNIPTDRVDAMQSFLEQRAIPTSTAYPLVRSRLLRINGQDVKEMQFTSERSRHLVNHVFNMSYADALPPDNEIIEGQWFGADDTQHGFSVELDMARDLNLKLGDVLQFSVGGSTFEAEVRSTRSVVWENFQPNFYVLATPELLASKPQTWLMSAYLDDGKRQYLKPLLQQFPSVTLLDISEIMQRIKTIIARASLALKFFFVFAAISAAIVLLSALNSANRIRELEIALLQALGANQQQKRLSQMVEFVLMGTMVGLFAAFFANLTGWLIGHWFFDLSFVFSPSLWITSLSVSILVITTLGMLFIHRSFSISPMRLLRS